MAIIKEVNLKVNDLQPAYFVQAIDSTGAGIDLTAATIVCTMKSKIDGTLKINRQSAGIVINADQVNNAGQFQYQWQAGDTDVIDDYLIEFEITPVAGGKFTIPNSDVDSPATVNINASLDAS